MPKPTKGPRLGSGPAHERLLLGTLAEQLFQHGKITTTEAKAKEIRPLVEKLVTRGKTATVSNRRVLIAQLGDAAVTNKLIKTSATYADRKGGYLRITKMGPRKGDGAAMAVIEFV